MSPITRYDRGPRPAAEVFAYATDPIRFSGWQKGVVDGHMEEADTPRVGARCFHHPKHRWRQPAGHLPARSHRPTQVLGRARRRWSDPGHGRPHLEPLTETRSRLTIAGDFEGHGIGKILVPLVVRRQAQKEMPGNDAETAPRNDCRVVRRPFDAATSRTTRRHAQTALAHPPRGGRGAAGGVGRPGRFSSIVLV
jgi:hypothetical protein